MSADEKEALIRRFHELAEGGISLASNRSWRRISQGPSVGPAPWMPSSSRNWVRHS